jgi:predicted nucleic acid-binding protein
MKKYFFDSNLLIYSLLDSQDVIEKRELVLDLLQTCFRNGRIIVSIQIINEIHWVLTSKFRIDETLVRRKISGGIMQAAEVMPLSLKNYTIACDLRDRYRFSFWDSLIASSALEAGCATLYSEDYQHNQVIEGKLKIVNPFQE